jgi:Methyltransferase domain
MGIRRDIEYDPAPPPGRMSSSQIYAEPRVVTDMSECLFYHTMELPGYGTVEGLFDLRAGAREYLGGIDLAGKRVLEIGTANGFLCFHMERCGAEVVAYDLSDAERWDFVPFADGRAAGAEREHWANGDKLRNAYWLAHRLYGSRARVVYGTVYDVPAAIGPVDVTTFGCVLLHLRDPVRALERALALTREQVVVTELLTGWLRPLAKLWSPAPVRRAVPEWSTLLRALSRLQSRNPVLLPDARRGGPTETWWALSPRLVRRLLGILGFERTRLTFHFQRHLGRPTPMFTVVGERTRGSRPAAALTGCG